ncbi:MAG: hypothetical protein VKJ04_00705 [Vampirovibrionales bacterium]|nr:hypothetical protein [Vampirovibrionales bacterium]
MRDHASSDFKKRAWTYQRPKREQTRDYTLVSLACGLFRHLLLFLYASLGSVFVLSCLYWLCAGIFAHTFFGDRWMQPVIVLLAAFFSGVLTRMLSDVAHKSMGLFLAAIAGFATYAILCGLDLQANGSLFSTRLLPEPLKITLAPYLYLLTPTGLFGMLCFRWFTLR